MGRTVEDLATMLVRSLDMSGLAGVALNRCTADSLTRQRVAIGGDAGAAAINAGGDRLLDPQAEQQRARACTMSALAMKMVESILRQAPNFNAVLWPCWALTPHDIRIAAVPITC
eukprot:COSAG05_NODE_6680_length_921_cov_1.113139_1_plen_115_part_00